MYSKHFIKIFKLNLKIHENCLMILKIYISYSINDYKE
jgi:hypothetical protein